MSQIKPSHLLTSLVIALTLVGCGDKNDKTVFNSDDGHPSGWVKTHKATAKIDIESCKTCHGDNYGGGISAVSCMSATPLSGFACHVTSPAANTDNCLSCHGGKPSGPFGTAAPNRKSAHTKHTALTECATCHLNAGYGTVSHAKASVNGGYSIATVALSSTYNSNESSGSYGYKSDGTCTNISCHGGITTPVWANGTIGLVAGDNAICLKCHERGTAAGVPQSNSFYSGTNVDLNKSTHAFHLEDQGAKCTECHNIGTLTDYQKHYSGIATKTFTAPGLTVGGKPTTKIGSYSTVTKQCSDVSCHSGFGGSWVKGP